MKISIYIVFAAMAAWLVAGCTGKGTRQESESPVIEMQHLEKENRIEVLADGELFTSYRYDPNFEKPFLFPVTAANGTIVTRGYPIEPREGESVDHPHHTGFWFTYGNINGIDFWGTSKEIPDSVRYRYGTIRMKSIQRAESNGEKGFIEVVQEWINPGGSISMEERVNYSFFGTADTRIIDRTTTLTAVSGDLHFGDTKEGAFAIRVARFLRFPSAQTGKFVDSYGNITETGVPDAAGMTGDYLSSAGIRGKEVWGTRAKWMNLYGLYKEDTISLVLMDHPDNLNHPTYWHARTYGLFSANPFGVRDFTSGQDSLDFSLASGEEIRFRHRLLVHSGDGLDWNEIDAHWEKFANGEHE